MAACIGAGTILFVQQSPVAAQPTSPSASPTPDGVSPELLACARDYEGAQVAAKGGKLRRAVELATACSREACPAYARMDCLRFVEEYKAQTPSIVVVAKDATGCDTTDARVSVDGAVVLESVDGRAIEIDPGEHTLRVEVPGVPAEEQKVVIAQGQKDRAIRFGESRGELCRKGPTKPPPPPPAPMKSERSGLTIAGMVVGGVGLASLTAGAGFAIAGFVQRSDLEECKPCSQTRIDDVRQTFIVGDVLLGAGAAAVGTAIVLLVVGGNEQPAKKPAVSFGLAPAAWSVGVSF